MLELSLLLTENLITYILRKYVCLGLSLTFCPPRDHGGEPHIGPGGQNIRDRRGQDRGGQGQLWGRVGGHPPQGGLRRQPRPCQGNL